MTSSISHADPLAAVSRETIERLRLLEALSLKWTKHINLTARGERSGIWRRHILDSAQLYALAPKDFTTWVDLGSGGGFPGLVISIMASDLLPDARITLLESDQRKAAFLRVAAAELGLSVGIITDRAESAPPLAASVLSARALAKLPVLLFLARRHLAPGGVALFPKGKSVRQEIEAARTSWNFQLTQHESWLEPDSHVLEIRDIHHV